jgi:hypothetical protein
MEGIREAEVEMKAHHHQRDLIIQGEDTTEGEVVLREEGIDTIDHGVLSLMRAKMMKRIR